MKRLDIINLVLSIIIIVALGIALYFIGHLDSQVALLSEGIGSTNNQMVALQDDIQLSNSFAKQNSVVINDLKERINAVALLIETGEKGDIASTEKESVVTEAFPYVEIWMDKDYTINRSSEENGKGNLGWVVVYNGEVVLDRNAEGEMSYTYFRTDKGAYVIYMTDFVDGQYRVISNVISYTIE